MDDYDLSITFSEWFKRRRKALDMTQDELARRVGCSVGMIRKIEVGERKPSKQLAGLLAEVLEISNEDTQTFIRVARGELTSERLSQTGIKPLASFSESWLQQQTQQEASSGIVSKPSSLKIRIPLQTTPIIGRDAELAALQRLIIDPECRLITLTGIGGIGKTRLAIEFALRNQSLFPGGIFYIPLTAVNSPDKIAPAIADVLEINFSGPTDPKEQLLNYISNNFKQWVLIILDNLEHLLDQPSRQDEPYCLIDLICEVLERSQEVKILATSREHLNVHGEWMYELHGLSIPPSSFEGELRNYDSIDLFVKSAQQIRNNYQITDDERPALIEICRMVEGVPLAIKLAAAWVNILSCQEIAQEIKSNMDFLTTSMRGIPERHRSIRATFDHSWKLLSGEERLALCQLAVFRGGFDRIAAEQIANASLPVLGSLVGKSLVRRTENGRYDLHEVIRQYAFSHLNQYPQKLGTYERHCEYYLTMVEDHERSFKSATQQEAVRQLTDEIDNIRAAWSWATQHEAFSLLDKAGRGFGWYYEVTGLYDEGIEQLEMLIHAVKSSQNFNQRQRIIGLALLHQALLYFRKGEFECSQKCYKESIDILRPTGDKTLLADALIFLGIIQHLEGEYELSRSSVEEGLILAQESKDEWFEAYAIYNLGYIASMMGRYTEGYEQMMAGLEMWRAIGDPHYISLGLNFLVTTLIKLGRIDEAKTFMKESIALCEQSNNRWGMGTAYRYLGLAYIADGQLDLAQSQLTKSLEIFGGFTIGWDIARSMTYLGDANLIDGKFAEAKTIYQQALQLSMESKSIPIALDALIGLSELQSQAGDNEGAIELCYFVLSHPASEDITKYRAEQLSNLLETKIKPERGKLARKTTQTQTFEGIVANVLKSS